jgi:hypothetical protein
MEDIVKTEGDDYGKYSTDSKKCIASCVSIAVSIKGVLDTQILTDDGLLTDESHNTVVNTEEFINHVVRLETS